MAVAVARPDPGIAEFITANEALFTAAYDALPINRQRELYDKFWRRFHAPRPAGVTVEEVFLPGPGGVLRALLYRPVALPGRGRMALPVVAYFHGGGWTLGSPESHDIATSRLCAQANVAVLSLDYRLSPEHRFPDALMDCIASVEWLALEGRRRGLDPDRLAVAGDSAGGNLAAALCLWMRDKGGPKILFQALMYPALTCEAGPGSAGRASEAALKPYLQAYFGGPSRDADPYAMPLSAKSLANLPRAYIATASLDPILFHGERYADRLRHDGVTCDYSCGFGLPHTYLRALHLSWRAAEAFDALCAATSAALGADRPSTS